MGEIIEWIVQQDWLHFIFCGSLGAFLVLAADFFGVKTGFDFTKRTIWARLLWIVAGGTTAFAYSMTSEPEIQVAWIVGGAWPYPIIGAIKVAETWVEGRKIQKLNISAEDLISAAREGGGPIANG